jgi:hypothetical protein
MFTGINAITLLGMIISLLFTILTLLYAFGDNTFFRIMIHILIGASAGYAGAIALRNVLIPQLQSLLVAENKIPLLFSLLWVVLLLMKISPRTAPLGNPASALLVGVGAAVAIGGAIQGTIIPQVIAATDFFNPTELNQYVQSGQMIQVIEFLLNGSITTLGTITTLIYFHFSARHIPNQIPKRNKAIDWVGKIGKAFIAATFGVIFAGVYSAALSALIERFTFIVNFISLFLGINR